MMMLVLVVVVVVMVAMMSHMEILKGKDTYFQQLAVLGGAKEKPKKERVRLEADGN